MIRTWRSTTTGSNHWYVAPTYELCVTADHHSYQKKLLAGQRPLPFSGPTVHCKGADTSSLQGIRKGLCTTNQQIPLILSGIHVSSRLKTPGGRSNQTMKRARPVVYIVNNTLHYADPQIGTQANADPGLVLCWFHSLLHACHKKVCMFLVISHHVMQHVLVVTPGYM